MSKKSFLGKGKSTLSLLRAAIEKSTEAGDLVTAAKLLELLTKREDAMAKQAADEDRIRKEQRISQLKFELGESK